MARSAVTFRRYLRTVPGSLLLDGVAQFLDLGNAGPVSQALTSFSMALWQKREKFLGITANFGNNNNAAQTNFNFQTQAAGRKLLTTIVTNNGAKALVGSNNISGYVWYHLVLTYDGANINWYVNGQFDSTTTHTGTVAAATTGTNIGTGSAPVGGAFRYFGGYQCEHQFWNSRVLTASDVALLAAGTPDSSLRTGLASEWLLYTNGNDSVGSNNATASGSPVFSSTEVPVKNRTLVSNRVATNGRTVIN